MSRDPYIRGLYLETLKNRQVGLEMESQNLADVLERRQVALQDTQADIERLEESIRTNILQQNSIAVEIVNLEVGEPLGE